MLEYIKYLVIYVTKEKLSSGAAKQPKVMLSVIYIHTLSLMKSLLMDHYPKNV